MMVIVSRRRGGRWGVVLGTIGFLALAGCPGTLPPPDGGNPPGGGSGTGMSVDMKVSPPANGEFFTAGERVVITVECTDDTGTAIPRESFGQARLMISGPKSTLDTVTAVGLMNVSDDRAAEIHHYVKLNDEAENPHLVAEGGKLTFTTEPISDEPPGTYIVGFWGTISASPVDQVFPTAEFQVGTSTEQADIVGNCGDCHYGPESGKYYLHHIDPGYSPVGNYAIDSAPVSTCKTCHNQAGYAAYCADREESPCSAENRVADPIVRRVHGVHNGSRLRTAFNADPDNGDFRHYAHVIFPSDVKDCTKCHLDDSWSTKPSRLACGACHDYVDFATGALEPPRVLGKPASGDCVQDSDCDADFGMDTMCNLASGECELGLHRGGPQANDAQCALCHTATAGVGPVPIPDAHEIPPPNFQYNVELNLSPPANGLFYVDEAPVLTVTIRDSITGAPIDPNTITESEYPRANIFVSGPREHTEPVLSTAAEGIEAIRAEIAGANQPWDFSTAVDFQLRIDGRDTITINVADGSWADLVSVTTEEVLAWLRADPAFAAAATVVADVSARSGADRVRIKSNSRGSTSSVEILESDVGTVMGLPTGVTLPEETHSYANNDFRLHVDPFDDDPRVTRSQEALFYQLDSVAGLEPGTYTVWVEVGSSFPVSWGLMNFQVGTDVEEAMVATSCTDCHEDTRQHASYFAVPFNPDICKSCHDYERQLEGRVGWASAGSNMGFGAAPLARRVHGVHFGHYLDKPEEIHPSYDYSEVIFPQDVRNCTKCHSTESTAWAEEPSRLACLACHDSDAALAHGTLMTLDLTPEDPWSGDEEESCQVCHSSHAEFAVSEVHRISDPYVPPYPREPSAE